MHEKIERLPAYMQPQAIDHALKLGTGCSLADFAVPNNCIIRPLGANESRILHPRANQWCVCTTTRLRLVSQSCLQNLHIRRC